LFCCGYVPLVPLCWLRLTLLFFVFPASVLVLSFSCGGQLKVCRVLASVFILYCGGMRVGMVGREGERRKDVGEVCTVILCKSCVMF
jgi:hypothetical protein